MVKSGFLIVLMVIYQAVYIFVKKADRIWILYTLVYWAINTILLLFVWPGIWRLDEFGILGRASNLILHFWHNYLTSIFYILSLMIFPIPSGVVIGQYTVISFIAGFLVSRFVKRFGKTGHLAFLPWLFLPVLDSNMYPIRMSLYGVLELLLFVLIFEIVRSAKQQKDSRIWKGWFVISVLAAVLTVWRSEAIYYLIAFPILLWLLLRKNLNRRKICLLCICYIFCAVGLMLPQAMGTKKVSGNQYELTGILLPLGDLVAEAYGKEECREQLEAVDQVINVELAAETVKNGKTTINLFWNNDNFQRNYSDEQYADLKKAYLQLIFKFPGAFMKNRWHYFIISDGLLGNTIVAFDEGNSGSMDNYKRFYLSQPFEKELRGRIIKLLEWRQQDDYNVVKKGYKLIYGPYLPIAFMVLSWLWCLFHKKWDKFCIITLPLIKVPLTFLTAPDRFFMYYYSAYLIGWFLFIYFIINLFWKRRISKVDKG